MKTIKKFRLTILGVLALITTVALNVRHALNDYGVLDNKLHMEVLAQSNGSGGSSSGGSSSGGSSSNNYSTEIEEYGCQRRETYYLGSITCSGGNVLPQDLMFYYTCLNGGGMCMTGYSIYGLCCSGHTSTTNNTYVTNCN
jgi:hypothetical protein